MAGELRRKGKRDPNAMRPARVVNTRQSSSAADIVQARLREDIVAGKLKPGERLREQELSQLYEVSRTPVREALGRLEVEGIAARHAGKGLVVAAISPEQIIELYVLREVLEGAAARLAAERRSETDLARLDAILEGTRNTMSDGANERLVDLNAQFHFVLWRIAGNQPLLRFMHQLQDSINRFQRSTLLYPGRMGAAVDEHSQILEAIRLRDRVNARELAEEHMRRVRNLRIAMATEAMLGSIDSATYPTER
jgi:DNA-binding GntR family transcriptional regulator